MGLISMTYVLNKCYSQLSVMSKKRKVDTMYKIYIIEDDINISKTIEEHLSKYQFECYTVQQFNQIVEEFQAIQPHLVVMDINLPTYDGYFW
ncbi:Response regulator receiver domain-containing protein [Lysinibacillus sp. AC-3]|nr:Response regulator receiver domain-containing protein [Lysinibacillus sp. AC-3]